MLRSKHRQGLARLGAAGLVAVGLLMGIGLSLWPPVSAQGHQPFLRPSYYLTTTRHTGATAPNACVRGFHMASMWEILEPSNLRYDTELGTTQDDSGAGPPSFAFGWIRTGFVAETDTNFPGADNCDAWRTEEPSSQGTMASLPISFVSPDVTVVSPWESRVLSCSLKTSVWCVQD